MRSPKEMNEGTPQAPKNGASGSTPPGGKMAGDDSKVSGQDTGGASQEDFERVALAGLDVLYNEQTNGQIMQMLQAGAGMPGEALAQVTTLIITELDDQAGGQIPEDVIIPAAVQIMAEAMKLGQGIGMQIDENVQQEALALLYRNLAEHYETEPGELEELMAGMSQQELQGIQQQFSAGNPAPAAAAGMAPQAAPGGVPA